MKLRSKILGMCLSCTLLALVLQTVLFQNTSSSIIYNRTKEESENSLQNMQNEIYSFLKHIESNLIEVYSEEEFIQALKNELTIRELRNEYYRKAYEIGTNGFETSDKVVALYLYTPEHEIISTYRRAVTPKHNYEIDIYSEPEKYNTQIVKEYIDSGKLGMLVTSYFNEYRDTDIMRFVLKLYDSRNYSRSIGYIVCDIDGEAFTAILDKYSIDDSMFIWLQPAGDRPAASIGSLSEEQGSIYKDTVDRIRGGDTIEGGYSDRENQELFQAAQNKYNLTAYSLMPQELLKQNQKALTINLLLIGGVMVIAAAFLSIYLSKSMTRPLVKLTDTMQEIREGNARLRAEVQNKDEIGQLAINFNEMLDRMEELNEKEKQTSYLLSQAEYKALQAQINPHFLYNTLDTMSSIAQIKDCGEVSSMCQSLSNMFRYALNMKEPFSTIAKEIAHLKNYCYVMEMRMQDHVQYVYEIDESLLFSEIPRLTLQPLVENALTHGLRTKRGEKYIRIEAKKENGNRVICVADNGIGANAEEINRKLEENDISYVEQGSSIGVYNINARLRMLYGEEYGLRIESKSGEGTRVYVTIPRQKPGGEGQDDSKKNI